MLSKDEIIEYFVRNKTHQFIVLKCKISRDQVQFKFFFPLQFLR